MPWRKCLVRSLVFAVLGGLAFLAWLYLYCTDPGIVREHVVHQIEAHFRNTAVHVDSARLRLLGGVSLNELRLIRQDHPELGDILYVPEAVIYHDKEQLLQGVVAIRKIELHRPRLRLVRGRDGHWNVGHILITSSPDEPLPTVVIEQGTILVEDLLGAPDLTPVEIRDVSLTMINDPLPTLDLAGRGGCDLLGPLLMHAVYQRASEAATLSLETNSTPVGAALMQRLAAYSPSLAENLRGLQGVAQVQAVISRQPGAERHWAHVIRCQLGRGKFSHPQLPLAVEDLEAHLRSDDGRLTLERLTGRAGTARVELTAAAQEPSPDTDLSGKLTVEHLTLAPELLTHAPEPLREIQADYAPAGLVDLRLDFARTGGQWQEHSVVAVADVTARFVLFPYSIEHLKGIVEHDLDPAGKSNVKRLDLIGLAGTRPIHLKGEVAGFAPHLAVNVDVWGEDLPLDEKLRLALPEKCQKLAASFHPVGLGDFVAHIRRAPEADRCANQITVRFHDAAVNYDVFPYLLEQVSGVLDILPDHWEFHDFRGIHKGGEFRVSGRSHPTPTGDQVSVEIRGNNLLLDDELQEALTPRGKPDSKLKLAWLTLHPGGRMNVAANIDQLPEQPEDVDVTVTARGCTLKPEFFPYSMAEVSGTVHYAKNRVDVMHFTARHGDSVIDLEQGRILLKPAGGFYARLTNLQGAPLIPDRTFQEALPPGLQTLCKAVELKDPLTLTARELIVDAPSGPNLPPVIWWDGGVGLKNASVQLGVDVQGVTGQFWCRGLHNGRQMEGLVGNVVLDQAAICKQPLRDVCCHLEVAHDAPEVLRVSALKGHIFGGDVGGQAHVEFGPTLHYDLNLTATQVKLEEFGRHNLSAGTELTGQATARLHLRGTGAGADGVEGHGSIDVPSGKMYNLPLLLNLLKVLGLRMPDRTAFEEAHAAFALKGSHITVNQLDLYGNAISLSGQGEINLENRDLHLDFYAVWGRIMQVLPPLLRPLPPALAQQLLKIEMRGKLDDPRCVRKPVPTLVEPLERLLKQAGAAPVSGGRDSSQAPAPEGSSPPARVAQELH